MPVVVLNKLKLHRVMTKARATILLFLTIISLQAQEWNTDYKKAKETASAENKTVILVFQGSDWCAPCMKLDREVWSTEKFKSYAKDHYVMVKADFPRKKKNALPIGQQEQNNSLAEMYNREGYFPLVVVLSSKGELKGKTGYKKLNPEAYIQHLNSFK